MGWYQSMEILCGHKETCFDWEWGLKTGVGAGEVKETLGCIQAVARQGPEQPDLVASEEEIGPEAS